MFLKNIIQVRQTETSVGRTLSSAHCLIFRVSQGTLTKWKMATCEKHGGVAQLGEHLPCKQGVDSSILFISTMVGREGNEPLQSATIWAHSSGG